MSKEATRPTKFYGQWRPHTDEVLWENYFQGKKNGVFVDCGAGIGLGWSNCYVFEKEFGWVGINLEASPTSFKTLQINRPNVLNLNIGLSNKNGTETFNDVGNDNGSFQHHPKHLEKILGMGRSNNYISVETITFKKLVDRYYSFPLSKIDLFSLDVEGYELQVIEGMKGTKVFPDVICVEHSISGLDNITEALKEFGYYFNFVSVNNAFYSFMNPSGKEWYGDTGLQALLTI
jgi:FkbM family methyltransferase